MRSLYLKCRDLRILFDLFIYLERGANLSAIVGCSIISKSSHQVVGIAAGSRDVWSDGRTVG